jgi:hypothetical protein
MHIVVEERCGGGQKEWGEGFAGSLHIGRRRYGGREGAEAERKMLENTKKKLCPAD